MTVPIKLKATSEKETGAYSVEDESGRNLFEISVEESGRGTVYDNKKNPVLELRIE